MFFALTNVPPAEGVLSLRVYDAGTQRGVRGACALRARPCAHLCLPVSEELSECRCATGYQQHGDNCTGAPPATPG